MTGTIKNVNAEKGFGFIKGQDKIEYFFHRSALKNCQITDLQVGQEVIAFEETEGTKGPRAEDIYV